MANTKFSGATAQTTPLGTDEVPFARSSTSNKITVTNLAKLMPGYELAYNQITSDVTTTQTSAASATTWLTSSSVTYDGSTIILIEFAFSYVSPAASYGVRMNLWEDSTDLGVAALVFSPAASAMYAPVRAAVRRTPTAGAKVYTVRAWLTGAGTGTGGANTGGTPPQQPAFIRITRVS